jgi:pimeloyl-ACP methyl ester carboxylesterase
MAINPFVFKNIFAGFSANSRTVKADPSFCDSLEPLRARFSRLDMRVMSLLFAGLHGTDASPTIRNVTAPSLIIGGEADPIIPISETRHVASLVPESTLVEVADCGHLFFCEAPERIWPRIIEWIRQHHD